MILVAHIKAAVAEHYSVSVAALEGKSKLKEFVRPRHVAMTLSRQLIEGRSRSGGQTAGISLPMIGRRFGNRDHTTVLSAVRGIERLCLSDPVLRNTVDSLSVGLLLREGWL